MEIIDGITYHRMYELEEGYGQVRLLRYFEVYQHHLARKVIELQPSVVHAASNHLNGLVGNAVAAHFGLPSIYEVRGLWEITRISRQPSFEDSTYFEMMVKMETQACREATGCLAITQGLIEEINRRLGQPRDVGYLPNGVEIERFSPRGPDEELRAKLGFPPEAVIIGYIGSIVSYEGLDLLMEALESGEDGAKPRRRNKPGARQKTLGEVLCERLRDEPPAWAEVWAELKQSRLDVTTAMIDGLLKACGKSGGGLHDAIGMLRDASASGMMHQPVRNQALGSLLNLAIELDWDVDAAVNEINDVDRESPEVIAAIGAVYCSGTRSPF